MLEYIDKPKRMKSTNKYKEQLQHCYICGAELNPYEWYEINVTLASPYERVFKNKMYHLSELDEEHPYYDKDSPLVLVDVIYPDWHRNRKVREYYCKDCVQQALQECLDAINKK